MRKSWSRFFRLAAGVVAGLFCIAATQTATAEEGGRSVASLRVALIGVRSQEKLTAMWGPLLEDLGGSLGVTASPQFFSDYAGVVWALKAGDGDVAWVGNKGAIQAVDVAGAEVFAQRIDLHGVAEYRSYLITRAAYGLDSFDDVRVAGGEAVRRGGRFIVAFGDPNSTSGAVAPWYYLFHRNGLGFPDIFTAVRRGNHEDNFYAVARGEAHVGTISSQTFDRMCREEPQACAALRVIWRSPGIPTDPLVWRGDLDSAIKAKVAAFFYDYGRASPGKSTEALTRQRERLALMLATGFRPSDNSQMAAVREIDVYRAGGKPAGGEPVR